MKLQGVDACIETSLKEYGLAWIEKEKDFLFYYGIKTDSNGEYTLFDYGYFPQDCDVEKEFNWINWKEFLSYISVSKGEWLAFPLPYKIYDLVKYYGPENIFGTPYDKGKTYKEVRFAANRISYKD